MKTILNRNLLKNSLIYIRMDVVKQKNPLKGNESIA
jgi:hypothetical protein